MWQASQETAKGLFGRFRVRVDGGRGEARSAPGGAVAQGQHAGEERERNEGQHQLLQRVDEQLAWVACTVLPTHTSGYPIYPHLNLPENSRIHHLNQLLQRVDGQPAWVACALRGRVGLLNPTKMAELSRTCS